MKIAYFTESLPPKTDGVVNTLCKLIDTLTKDNVDFLFYSPVKPENVEWANRVKKVASIPFALYSYYRVGLPYFHGISAELDKFNPDLIHVVSPTLLGMHGLNYAKRRNLPVVTSYHTHFVRYFSYYGFDQVEDWGWNYLRWFHNQCDRTYAPSPSTVQELQGRGFKDVELWQRGIELGRFSPDNFNPSLRSQIDAQDKPVLLFVGRLVKEKDLDDLVFANDILKLKGHDFKLVMTGDGPMREELETRLPDAHFTGYQYGEALAEWYATADLFIFPSTTETFGNVILESFASGTPAVCVNKGGPSDIVNDHKDGFIANANTPEDFAQKIEILLLNTEKRKAFGVTARQTASQYQWDNINRQLISSYSDLVACQN